MQYVIVDCGGFKKIVPVEKVDTIRKLQDSFPKAYIEGDENGRAKLLTGEDVSAMLRGRVPDRKALVDEVLTQNVKKVNRRGRGK